MSRSGPVVWLVSMVALSAVAAAAPAPTDPLVAAYVAGDSETLAEAAGRLSAGQLDQRLNDKRRLVRLSAVAGLGAVDDPWSHLRALASAASDADRPVAVAAISAALTHVRRLDPGIIETRDLSRAGLAVALDRFRKLVADTGRWADVRVLALETSNLLARRLGDAGAAAFLHKQIGSDEPEVRRAALELLPQPLSKASRAAAAAAIADKHDLVAATAAAVICQGIAAGDAAAPLRDALGRTGAARAAALRKAPPPGLEPAMLRYLGACTKASGKTK